VPRRASNAKRRMAAARRTGPAARPGRFAVGYVAAAWERCSNDLADVGTIRGSEISRDLLSLGERATERGLPVEALPLDLLQTETVGSMFFTRTIERIIIVLFGGLSIVLGWHLFKIGVVTEQKADIEGASFTVKLIKVGPGVFFALFGAFILVVAMNTVIEVKTYPQKTENRNHSESGPVGVSVAGMLGSDRDIAESVNTLNAVTQIITRTTVESADGLSGADQHDLLKHRQGLIDIRDSIVAEKIGRSALILWRQHHSEFQVSPYNLSAETREKMEEIEKWFKVNR